MRNVLIFILLVFIAEQGIAETKVRPQLNNGQKWRVAYYEGGSHFDYRNNFVGIIQGLMKKGWLEETTFPVWETETSQEVWNWLSETVRSDWLSFQKTDFLSSGWDKEQRVLNKERLYQQIDQQQFDIVIAMGTWAGLDLTERKHELPVLVAASADPLASGIVKSSDYSGTQNIFARTAPGRFKRQIEIFYELVGFQKLGIAYEDTNEGRSYAAVNDIEQLSKRLGYEVVACHTTSNSSELDTAEKSVIDCYQYLAQKSDGIYVTVQSGVNKTTVPMIAEIAKSAKVPTFSQNGGHEISKGLLMSVASSDYQHVGMFYAKRFSQILSGALPGTLHQIYEDPKRIEMNVGTANLIGYDIPIEALLAADKVYGYHKGTQTVPPN